VVLSLLGLNACGTTYAEQRDDGMEASGITWSSCGNYQCAEVSVPIDYAAPRSGSVKIAINRVTTLGAERRGVVFVNPGGPGAPGKAFMAASAQALRALLPGYDFIGFDPRGVGESEPVRCSMDVDVTALLKSGGVDAMLDGLRSASQLCARENRLFNHVGSNQVVQDIDQIRQALEVEEINFIGLSYGTRLGALYAQAFPEHARAVVLDAPVSPIADVTEEVEAQFDALLQAQDTFFADCASATLSCPPDPEGIFDRLVATQPTDGDRSQFLANWKLLLSAPPGREVLAQLLTQVASGQVMTTGDMPVMASVNALANLNGFANLSTNCADSAVAPPTTAEAEAILSSFQERAPQFADSAIAAFACSGWEVQSDPAPPLAFTPRVPPFVIGGTADSLTPLQWARDTSAALVGSSLLLSEHYGHGALLYGSECVFDFIKAYLDDLTLAPEGARCAAPPQP
jgi:pimeloyl-ACP methyl ester carboxylesterase